MIIEKNNTDKLEFKDLNSAMINGITSEFLQAAEVTTTRTMQDLSNVLKLLNIEFNSNATFSNNHYILLLKNKEMIGYAMLSDIVQSKKARIRIQLIDDYSSDKEIQHSLKETIDLIFDRFKLDRLSFQIHKSTKQKQPEAMILKMYQAFPIGFLHADDNIAEFVIRNKRFSPKEDFYSL
ncbi:hypothetical protein [Aequorivita marina]|uniref:hypothetical protein n=1 Tax=Aequorivita marina TaxID=3073654 RepID=UPI00287582E9|nr:hypothetical protein [Aequorivita sp. S2608]MDS1297547.1 hypothetical protein [Aequorivita sp. S2608]